MKKNFSFAMPVNYTNVIVLLASLTG